MRTIRKVETCKVGKRGTVTIPANLRKRYGLTEGSAVIFEKREDGILIRPLETPSIEIYTDERIAEFLLNNAVGPEDYEDSRNRVKAMGLDPDTIPHVKPE